MNQEPYQEFEMDLYQIVEKVFSGPIQKPYTYQILFDEREIDPSTTQTQYIFEQLLMVFVEGLKVYFKRDEIDISQITPEDFFQIQQYFKSMGFQVNCQIEPILDENKINQFLESNQLPSLSSPTPETPTEIHQSSSGQSKISATGNDLKDFRYTLIKGNDRYIITFDYAKHV